MTESSINNSTKTSWSSSQQLRQHRNALSTPTSERIPPEQVESFTEQRINEKKHSTTVKNLDSNHLSKEETRKQINKNPSKPLESSSSTHRKTTRNRCGCAISSLCCQILSSFIVGLLAAVIISIAVVIPVVINNNQSTTTQSTSAINNSQNPTTLSMNTTSTTATTATTTTTTTNNQTTTTTTSTTTTSRTTTTTTSTTTTVTTTTTTATTTTTTRTTTTTTATTTTTTATTTTTSATTTTTSATTTTTTTPIPSCSGWSWNTTGVTVAGVTGSSGSSTTQFNLPWDITLDSSNNLYIADSANHRIQKWSFGASSGVTIAGTGVSGATPTQLNNPRAVYLSGNNMYVADGSNSRVQLFVNGSTSGVTVISQPSGQIMSLDLDTSGSIFTANMNNNTIRKNTTVFASGASINGPQGVTVMSNGSVLIVNTQLHNIIQWEPGQSSGSVVAGTTGVFGSNSSQLKYPTTVVADVYGNFWIADNNNHRIQFYCRTLSNTTLGRTVAGGSMGTASNQLNYPVGIAFDASLNMYVADTSNHRVQRFARIS